MVGYVRTAHTIYEVNEKGEWFKNGKIVLPRNHCEWDKLQATIIKKADNIPELCDYLEAVSETITTPRVYDITNGFERNWLLNHIDKKKTTWYCAIAVKTYNGSFKIEPMAILNGDDWKLLN